MSLTAISLFESVRAKLFMNSYDEMSLTATSSLESARRN